VYILEFSWSRSYIHFSKTKDLLPCSQHRLGSLFCAIRTQSTHCLFNNYINIIFLIYLCFQASVSFKFSFQTSVSNSVIRSRCQMRNPSNSHWFHHPDNIWREAQIVLFLVRQFSPISYSILSLSLCPDILHSTLFSNALCKPPFTFVPHSVAPLPHLLYCFSKLKRHLEVQEHSHIN